MKIKCDKTILNDVLFHSITFLWKKQPCTLASGWSLKKGDWWYESDPSTAKFFDLRKTISEKGLKKYGIYIGRFALVLMTK